jgi:putative hydrolase of the HAD superfamily
MATTAPVRAIVLDFGGPVLLTPFELLRPAEARLGLAAGTLDWHGPFRPDADPAWCRMQAGEITERQYWTRRAVELDALTGVGADLRDLFGLLYDADPAVLVRPQAGQLLAAASEAGIGTAVLTNDLGRFHPPAWIAGIDFLARVGALVDGSVTGVLKPDPEAYRLVLRALHLTAPQAVFVDDQAANIAGAERVGLAPVWFDVTDPDDSYRRTYERAGLTVG